MTHFRTRRARWWAYAADENLVFGGFFWINGDGPCAAAKVGRDFKRQRHVNATVNKALEILMAAVPRH